MEELAGSCGENVNYSLIDGCLTISGTGEMDDYNDRNKFCPWYNKRNDIIKVIIENGVTSIGSYTFRCCRNLNDVEIGDDVTIIKRFSFDHSTALRRITGMINVKKIEISAFEFCDLDTMTLPDTLEVIEQEAFRYNPDLIRVRIPDSVHTIEIGAFIGMQRDFELVNDTEAVIEYCKHNSCHYCKIGEEGKERH